MFEGLIKNIISKDQELWYKINVLWQCDFLNTVTPILRNPITWTPLYLFLVVFLPYKFGKKGFYWCLSFLITFALSDYSSASIIKPLVQRIRPCNDISLQKIIHLLVPCGSGYSFPSSHATNHFALAFFMIFSLHKHYRWILLPSLLWAISISYSQVYVGVHYPLDVLCGGILGGLIGSFVGLFFKQKIGLGKK
jgi:membrane-associated phospholipid phosphatase